VTVGLPVSVLAFQTVCACGMVLAGGKWWQGLTADRFPPGCWLACAFVCAGGAFRAAAL